MPALARALATPAVRGTTSTEHELGTVWERKGSSPRALILYFTDSPSSARWLAGSLAAQLDARVLVARSLDVDAASFAGLAEGLGLDPALTAVVGEEVGASAALALCHATSVNRVALLYPTNLEGAQVSGVPTTLLQSAVTSDGRAAVVVFEVALRRAGVAVREMEYKNLGDGWARYPKAVAGSRAALGDLVAFLKRGIGELSTFEVIPGWDLH